MLTSSLFALVMAAVTIARPMPYQVPRHLQHLTVQKRAVDFGSCSNPTIIFAEGLDGRKQAAFGPANNADFNHGSALNIGIIASFICQRLDSSCKANQEAIDACAAAVSAASGQSGQAAADAFNAAVTGGAGGGGAVAAAPAVVNAVNPAVSNVGVSNAGVSNSNSIAAQLAAAQIAQLAAANPAACVQQIVTVTVTAGADAAAPTPVVAAVAVADSADQAAAAAAAAVTAAPQVNVQAAGNQQSFTGALGGISAPAVNVGGKGFVTNGSDFLNIGAALGRSCDVQKNQCANLANSGNADFSVTDCDAQNAACRAQI